MDLAVTAARAQARGWRATYLNLGTIPYWGLHVGAIYGSIVLGVSWAALGWVAAMYAVRMFFITGVYHRYFSHRTYKTSRWFQFVLALCAQATAQKGVMWWAGHHRRHHKHSDSDMDVHSPYHGGFWWSHMGWMTSGAFDDTDEAVVKDLAKFPELKALEKLWLFTPVVVGAASFLIGGWWGLVFAFAVPQVLSWHGTFTINSLSHVWGSKRYASGDDSRNNPVLARIPLGEGWPNHHPHFHASAPQGFYWWGIDLTYYGLRLLAALGLIRDLKPVPPAIRAAHNAVTP